MRSRKMLEGLALTIMALGQMMAIHPEATAQETTEPVRVYQNRLTRIENPKPLLSDYPEFFEPIIEQAHFEAPAIVQDENADLAVRAWRFSYNARGIIEMPNRIRLKQTAVIMVHPWGIDDGQGWRTPEPAGVCDFCTEEKNHLAGRRGSGVHDVVSPTSARGADVMDPPGDRRDERIGRRGAFSEWVAEWEDVRLIGL